jgi:hypothetical protein
MSYPSAIAAAASAATIAAGGGGIEQSNGRCPNQKL